MKFPSAIISQMKDILTKSACNAVLISLKVVQNLGEKKMPSRKKDKSKNMRERLRDLLTRTV